MYWAHGVAGDKKVKASALGQARSSCPITEVRERRRVAERGIESISF